ncbi:MAG: hypothetical protein R3332_07350 [Pseudohongiellaceae bacterium]|nr:hypothetical protein [Pseudohongiellaceae bacterium]
MIIHTLSRWSYRHSSPVTALLCLAVTAIIIAIFRSELPLTDSALREASGMGIIDVHFNHGAQFVMQRIDAYGEAGRQIYTRFIILDMGFVIAYGLALSFVLSLISQTQATTLNTIPFLASLSDACENTCHWLLLNIYPERSEALAAIASSATRFKFIFIALSVLIVLYLSLRAWQHRPSKHP